MALSTFIQGNGLNLGTGALSGAISFLGNTTAGTCLLLYILLNSTGGTVTVTSVTDTLGNTWAQKLSQVQSSGFYYIFSVASNAVGGADTITVNFSTSTTTFIATGIAEYSNPSAIPFEGETGPVDSTGTSYTGSPITTTATNDVVIGLGESQTPADISGASGWTKRVSSASFVLLDIPAPTIGVYTPTAASSPSIRLILHTVSLRSSSSVPVPTSTAAWLNHQRAFVNKR